MKYLNQFVKFDWKGFAKDKKFVVTGCSELKDYNTKQHLGTRVEVVIISDETAYQQKDGEQVSNRFEKLTFKVMKDVDAPIDALVEPVNAEAKVYGEYRNQLSVTAEDIRISQQSQRKA